VREQVRGKPCILKIEMMTNELNKPIEAMKNAMDALAEIVLSQDAPGNFDGDDLVNALCILQYVAHSLAWKNPAFADLTIEQRCKLAEETGKNLRQTMKLFTGIDPHDVLANSHTDAWPETIEPKAA